MSNERKLRLIQVAKEFKVGLNTLTDFMQKKGIKSDGSPNTLVEPETYAVLEKEFGGNRNAGSARESIRERISQKQTTVSIEETKASAPQGGAGGRGQEPHHRQSRSSAAAANPGQDRPLAQAQAAARAGSRTRSGRQTRTEAGAETRPSSGRRAETGGEARARTPCGDAGSRNEAPTRPCPRSEDGGAQGGRARAQGHDVPARDDDPHRSEGTGYDGRDGHGPGRQAQAQAPAKGEGRREPRPAAEERQGRRSEQRSGRQAGQRQRRQQRQPAQAGRGPQEQE